MLNYRFPATKILGFILVGMLVVAAAAFAFNYNALPNLKTSEANPGTSQDALPGLGPDTIADMVTMVSPAVVRINTTEQIEVDPFFNDPFFRYFFGEQFRVPSRTEINQGIGSGFIVSAEGYILTNEHVIGGADEIEVTLSSREQPYPAVRVGSDQELDLAVLKIDAGGSLPTVPLGDSDSIRAGDWVVAIGNPYGLDHTVTVGVISAKGRPITVENRRYKNLLQTDASINPGNSGGPLLNLNGEVVGINTAISAQAQGIGFAIPSSTVKSVFDELVNKGSVTRPWLGVYLQPVTQEAERYYRLNSQNGAIVSSVIAGSPAEKAGLQRNDIVLRYNGVDITTPDQLIELVRETGIDSQVEVRFMRGGEQKTLIVTIEARQY